MSKQFEQSLERHSPELYQLLTYVAANQYYADWLDRAVREYNEVAGEAARAVAANQIDATGNQLAANHDDLSDLTNYDLTTPDAARDFLATLHKGLVAGLAKHPAK